MTEQAQLEAGYDRPYVPVKLRNLTRLRERAGLSQLDLAEMAGVARPTISEIERGRKARASTHRALARALGVRPADLVGDDDIQERAGPTGAEKP